jgi:hypothetical protein
VSGTVPIIPFNVQGFSGVVRDHIFRAGMNYRIDWGY